MLAAAITAATLTQPMLDSISTWEVKNLTTLFTTVQDKLLRKETIQEAPTWILRTGPRAPIKSLSKARKAIEPKALLSHINKK